MVQYLIPKLLYVCLYGVLGSAIPYLSLFYADSLHLPSQQIGIILAIAPFIQSVACPFWTMQVDKRPQWHGMLMAILMLVGGLSVIALMFIPVFIPESATSAILSITIALAVTFAFFGQPVTVLVDSAVLKILGDNGIYYGKCGSKRKQIHARLNCVGIDRRSAIMGIDIKWRLYTCCWLFYWSVWHQLCVLHIWS